MEQITDVEWLFISIAVLVIGLAAMAAILLLEAMWYSRNRNRWMALLAIAGGVFSTLAWRACA